MKVPLHHTNWQRVHINLLKIKCYLMEIWAIKFWRLLELKNFLTKAVEPQWTIENENLCQKSKSIEIEIKEFFDFDFTNRSKIDRKFRSIESKFGRLVPRMAKDRDITVYLNVLVPACSQVWNRFIKVRKKINSWNN